ncbi:hypothetical protein QYH60_13990 (plasmid) [Lactococcus lactis subsp. lactis]|uniref:AbrB/MazE/SpoVT family DNA-binding domain-containing protein n=1 Tax=Lactococcus lactis TaxID=1358 RepID=UPI002647325C|nr:hypothetical protein [Lactococcus lactis]WKB50004.1 hypothetical protein QYH60_13990 [Lactococcus lactis subsp. lactis]
MSLTQTQTQTRNQTLVNETSKITSWGNSQGVRLGKRLLKTAGLKKDDKISINVIEGNKIVLSLAEPVDDGSLAYLFRNYKDDGKREPLIDFGERVGNEIFD